MKPTDNAIRTSEQNKCLPFWSSQNNHFWSFPRRGYRTWTHRRVFLCACLARGASPFSATCLPCRVLTASGGGSGVPGRKYVVRSSQVLPSLECYTKAARMNGNTITTPYGKSVGIPNKSEQHSGATSDPQSNISVRLLVTDLLRAAKSWLRLAHSP